jgi:hypothetical protein
MAIPPGHGYRSTVNDFPHLKQDVESITQKVLDEALHSQYDRNRTSKTLTGVQDILRSKLVAKREVYKDLPYASLQAAAKNISSRFKRYKHEVAHLWHTKLPVIFSFYLPAQTQQSLQEEFNLATDDVKEEVVVNDVKEEVVVKEQPVTDTSVNLLKDYIVHIIYNNEIVNIKHMNHLDVVKLLCN